MKWYPSTAVVDTFTTLNPDWVIAAFTVIITIVTWWQGRLIRRANIVARNAADAAKISADAAVQTASDMREAERGRVGVSSMSMDYTDTLRIRYALLNYGRSSIEIRQVNYRYELHGSKGVVHVSDITQGGSLLILGSGERIDSSERREKASHSGEGLLPPMGPWDMTPEMHNSILENYEGTQLFIIGCIVYSTAFGTLYHWRFRLGYEASRGMFANDFRRGNEEVPFTGDPTQPHQCE
ncbi:MAG: hypothetical protein KIT10_08170 [Flavobacteriales bacterium]|nr:hypothetical protein [Flavobacteriales bacterium]MCW5899233.1 hypothetical protein [Flavobacteriales bacterium]